ncbi:MAG: serine/threonine protein kinase, partial [Planctomycetes bacterium]|nr:serine/threonine protein kinase [Planctomycetota bacterium]
CEAMAYAHSEGVLHRDLKPSNVMVGPFGETYVLDWGLAKLVGGTPAPAATPGSDAGVAADGDALDATLAGDVVGTPSYMPPEQALGDIEKVDQRSDVYAVGAILYHALSGVRPYSGSSGDSPLDVVQAARCGPPEPLSRVARSVPSELVAICDRAMAREPDRRYASMQELADDLRAYLEGRVVRAHKTGALVELRKWIQRNKGAAAAVLAIVLGLVAVIVLQSRAAVRLRRRDYRNQVALASLSYERGDIHGMRALLDGCTPALRGWEWHALERLSDTSDGELRGHAGVVHCAAFAPDGLRLATGGRDRTLRVWDLSTGECVRQWSLPGEVLTVSFRGPQGVLVAAGDRIFAVDLDRGIQRANAPQGRWIRASLSPDGVRLLVGGDTGRVETWSAESLQCESVLVRGLFGVSCLAWSPDSKLAIVGGRDRGGDGDRSSAVRVFDATSGGLVHELSGHSDWLEAVAPSPDGAWLASGGWDGRVLIWDLASGARLRELAHQWSGPVALAWSDDGKALLAGGRPIITVWDVASWRVRGRFTGHTGNVGCIVRNGARFASAGADGARLWSLRGSGCSEVPVASAGYGLAFRPGCAELAVAGMSGWVEIWDVRQRRLARRTSLRSHRATFAFTPDGRRLVAGDRFGSVTVYDADTDAEVATCKAHTEGIAGLDVHPTLPRCVTAGIDGRVRLFELNGLRPLWTVSAGKPDVWPNGAHECAFSPDGRWIAAGANDGRLRLLDAETGALVRELVVPGEEFVYGKPAFSADGRRVAASVWVPASRLAVWDVDSGRLLWSVPGVRGGCAAPRFSRDGSRVLACTEKGSLLVFDA